MNCYFKAFISGHVISAKNPKLLIIHREKQNSLQEAKTQKYQISGEMVLFL